MFEWWLVSVPVNTLDLMANIANFFVCIPYFRATAPRKFLKRGEEMFLLARRRLNSYSIPETVITDIGNHLRFISYKFVFLAVLSSFSLNANEFPVRFRLKPDDECSPLHWEKKFFFEKFPVEQKIKGGQWEKVYGLRKKVKVGLTLGGGIVRSVAHIGVLRALEENYIPIDGISGTSMGAVIGGLYASGHHPDSLEFIVKKDIDWETFFQDQQIRNDIPIWERIRNKPRSPALEVDLSRDFPFIFYKLGAGIRVAQKYTDEIADKTLHADYRAGFDFSKLRYPFGAILTNLSSGTSTLKINGALSTALRASGSFPIAFEPMIIDNIQYVDGGILDNLPVDAFLPEFDSLRKPDTIMNIYDKNKGEDIFVIASYPSKLTCSGENPIETGEAISGSVGIGIMMKTYSLAREFHVWNSWRNADGKIDIDVKGGFDFKEDKLKELIQAGYDEAKNQIYSIKKRISAKEDSIDGLDISREVFKVVSINIFQIKNDDTLKIERGGIIKRAIKLKVGSYIEKNDICYVLRNIYNTGKYKNVEARIDKNSEGLSIEFLLTKKNEYLKPFDVRMIMGGNDYDDSLVAGEVHDRIKREKRKLSFYEIKELVEEKYVARGYIAPSVEEASFSSIDNKDILFIHGNRGIHLEGVKILHEDKRMRKAIQQEFKMPLSPEEILKKSREVYREYQLKTISIEGLKKDSLIIRVRSKTGHSLEFPVFSLEKDQGLNLSAELRTKRIRGFGGRSFYVTFSQNYPLKMAQELVRGYSYNIGFNKCSTLRFSLWSLVPDLSLGNRKSISPGSDNSNIYNTRYDELGSVSLSYPFYSKDFALSFGVESYYRAYLDNSLLPRPIIGFCNIHFDNLDRFVFPSSGIRISFETAADLEEKSWKKAKIKGIFPKRFRLYNRLKTVLSGEIYLSGCSQTTPSTQRYSMGGITPIGSHQLKIYDSEDLPGYRQDEFIEPYLFKIGGSARLTLVEMQVLGVKTDLHFIGSLYLGRVSDSFSTLFDENSRFLSLSTGFFLDTSFLNFGIGWENSFRDFLHDIYASVVLYGLGF